MVITPVLATEVVFSEAVIVMVVLPDTPVTGVNFNQLASDEATDQFVLFVVTINSDVLAGL
ncbi:hypothetical protein D3C72_1838260 [compost metagenome]